MFRLFPIGLITALVVTACASESVRFSDAQGGSATTCEGELWRRFAEAATRHAKVQTCLIGRAVADGPELVVVPVSASGATIRAILLGNMSSKDRKAIAALDGQLVTARGEFEAPPACWQKRPQIASICAPYAQPIDTLSVTVSAKD